MFQRYRQVPTPISAANIQLFADTGKKINKKHKRPENLITFSDPMIFPSWLVQKCVKVEYNI